MKISEEEILKMSNDYRNGISILAIAKKFNKNKKTVSSNLKKIGVQIKNSRFTPGNYFIKSSRVSVDYFHKSYKVDDATGCWIWQKGRTKSGYGQFWADKKMAAAHRFSYEISSGKIPSGLLVCHKCDNPPCVNPDHFFLGTHQDNVNDKMAKGRYKNKK